MEQILVENWPVVNYTLILCLTVAQLLVLYILSASRNPPEGLGMFTVYFMATLLCWLSYSLQRSSAASMSLDVPAIASIISAYILFLACGQRAQFRRGAVAAGIVCLIASLSAFFITQTQMISVQNLTVILFFGAAGSIVCWRGWRLRNIGDAVMAAGCGVMLAGAGLSLYRASVENAPQAAHDLALNSHTLAYGLIMLGFLASALVDSQRQLSHLETEDPLTRLANRRGLEDILRMTIANAVRRQLPTSVIMLDIDHFSQVNDSFGHETGDRMLQQIARILQHGCRGSDVVARTGGEEFLLVLPETEPQNARILAERLRSTIGAKPMQVGPQRIAVTASLGIAGSIGKVDIDALSKEARRAIYLAKRAGRNQVASAEPSSVTLTSGVGQV